jgi:hypothetical protein
MAAGEAIGIMFAVLLTWVAVSCCAVQYCCRETKQVKLAEIVEIVVQ